MHLSFANIFVGAKHSGSKSLLITNKLSAGMLRLQNWDAPVRFFNNWFVVRTSVLSLTISN